MLFRLCCPGLLLAALLPASLPLICASEQALQKSQPVVVFAITQYESGATIEPIVIINGARYIKPPTGEEADAPSANFAARYYRPNKKYRVLFGGGEAGEATVKARAVPGCIDLMGDAELKVSVKLGGEVMALATDSDALGRKPGSRRAPTPAERATVLELAQKAYRQRGVPASLIKEMKTVNLTATDLNGDGKAEMAGSFLISQTNAQYALFVLAEPAAASLKPALTWYHRGVEETYRDQKFVDQLDLDGDGQAEVFTRFVEYESHDYAIYKKHRGQWRIIYRGGGGGC